MLLYLVSYLYFLFAQIKASILINELGNTYNSANEITLGPIQLCDDMEVSFDIKINQFVHAPNYDLPFTIGDGLGVFGYWPAYTGHVHANKPWITIGSLFPTSAPTTGHGPVVDTTYSIKMITKNSDLTFQMYIDNDLVVSKTKPITTIPTELQDVYIGSGVHGRPGNADISNLLILCLDETESPSSAPTTLPPSTAPTEEVVCESDTPYNLMFILDESTSVSEGNYISSIDFVIERIMKDVNSVANIATLSYSSMVNERIYEFSADQSSRVSIIEQLELEKFDYDLGSTNTVAALEDALLQFAANFGDTENNLVFLITDGKPTDSNGQLDLNAICDKGDLLTDYRKYNMRVVVVGITDEFLKETVECIANNGDIFEIGGFDSQDFNNIESELRNILCPC